MKIRQHRRHDLYHVISHVEQFIKANSSDIVVAAPHDGAPLTNIFALLGLAAELKLEPVVGICCDKLSELQAHSALALMTPEWIKSVKLETARAALAALKQCPGSVGGV
jgi:hypothetical protein